MITVKIYDGNAPANLLATMSQSQDRQWLHQLNEAGSGSFKVHKRDTQLAARPDALHYGNIARFQIDGTDRFAIIIESRDFPPAPTEEASGEYWSVSGRGVLALLEDAVVYPEGTIIGSVIRQRRFDWTSIAYTDTSWIGAVAWRQGTDPGKPVGWPDQTAYWLWGEAPTGSPIASPAGTCYFRKTFTLSSDQTVRIHVTFDNTGHLFLDGEEIIDSRSTPHAYTETFTSERILSAGSHTLAAEVTNGALSPTHPNPGGFICAAYEVDIDTGTISTLIVHSDSTWKALDYPVEVPGMSVGQILRILIQEAQTRGALVGVTRGFTDTLDTRSATYSPTDIDLAIDIGTSLLDVVRTFVEQFIDVEMTPALLLNIYNKGTLGTDRVSTVDLRVGVHFEELSEQGQDHLTNIVLARDTSGILTTTSDGVSLTAHRRRESYLELALAPSTARAQDMSTQVLAEFALPTLQVTGRVKKSSGPYATWFPGDEVKMPDPLRAATRTYVISISVGEDEAGNETFWVEGIQEDIIDREVSDGTSA